MLRPVLITILLCSALFHLYDSSPLPESDSSSLVRFLKRYSGAISNQFRRDSDEEYSGYNSDSDSEYSGYKRDSDDEYSGDKYKSEEYSGYREWFRHNSNHYYYSMSTMTILHMMANIR